jgi:hypothetical protein
MNTGKNEQQNRFDEALKTALQNAPAEGCPEPEEVEQAVALGRRFVHWHQVMDHIAACKSCLQTALTFEKLERAKKISKMAWLKKFAQTHIRVDDGLRDGATELPDWCLAFLRRFSFEAPAAAYRAAATNRQPTVRVASPPLENSSVVSFPAAIAWREAPAAIGYEVSLEQSRAGIGNGFETVAKAVTQRPEWVHQARIKPGRRVRIRIRPRCVDLDLSATTVETVIEFRVLSNKQREQAEWAIEAAPAAPLTAAIVLSALGLHIEALKAAERIAENDQRKKLEAHIASKIESRRTEMGD